MALSSRRSKFVDEYCLNPNASAAARASGYSVTSAHVAASRLLRNDKVVAAIALKKQQLAQQYDIDKHRVVNELLVAVTIAREHLDGGTMIRGYCEIAKMLGIYAPEAAKAAVYAENEVLRAEYEAMNDDQLLAIANGDFTHKDHN